MFFYVVCKLQIKKQVVSVKVLNSMHTFIFKGKCKCDYQEKTPQKGSQKYPVNHM